MRAIMHGRTVVRTYDDDPEEILREDYRESGHDVEAQFRRPGQQIPATRRILVATLSATRFEVQEHGGSLEIYDTRAEEGDTEDLRVLRKYATSHDAARTQDADQRTLADASLPHRQRLAALGRINARRRHDLR